MLGIQSLLAAEALGLRGTRTALALARAPQKPQAVGPFAVAETRAVVISAA
ncbi:MAG: hypothetical protein M3O86_02370 [Actinomycetota bacterium]|nr:hypothetical protein [Actinomycetota bacterium]